MKAVIEPSKAEGIILAPPSKSMAHRYIICAALSEGVSEIGNISYSEDILATLDCVETMGAMVDRHGGYVRITGRGLSAGGKLRFNCRECGSTLRFFVPLAMLRMEESFFTGSETLLQRPMSVYEEIAEKQNILYEKSTDGIKVCGVLKSGEYEVLGNISSQFISGLIFALSTLKEDSVVKLIPPVDSRPYIELTIKALKKFGIEITWNDDATLYIKGGQKYVATEAVVEGDFSNSAFLEAFNTIGGEVAVEGLDMTAAQGDKVYFDYFSRLMEGRAKLNISDCPDLGPILFVVAAANYGGDFTGTKRLAIKESDRGRVMCEELGKFGVVTHMEEDSVFIEPGEIAVPKEELFGHNDHRIVMALSTLLTITGGSIEGVEAVKKSYPDYFECIKRLGIKLKLS